MSKPAKVVVTVALRRRRLVCPDCDFSTSSRYDRRPVASTWRHLDLGLWRLEVKAELRSLSCPAHRVRREAVPFARAGSFHTRDFEDGRSVRRRLVASPKYRRHFTGSQWRRGRRSLIRRAGGHLAPSCGVLDDNTLHALLETLAVIKASPTTCRRRIFLLRRLPVRVAYWHPHPENLEARYR